MIYDNSSVRRQDRLLSIPRAIALLQEGEYGVLSVCNAQNEVYGLPVNYVWDGAEGIFIHCAPDGKKLRYVDQNSRVSFCVVGKTLVHPAKFTTEYASIILACDARRNMSDEEKMKALHLLLFKYSPDDVNNGLKYAVQSLHRTEIIKLHILSWSGKSKSIQKPLAG